ncbi:MAG: tRNA (adenosine(37)-N6)-dimethylallyltransferase MiaA [Streptosporangiales bacterium]|nr:tRNA (adenosine(37)-N6)-dimethylallyltransferase MiaA [Streptosporangiales bacterium]
MASGVLVAVVGPTAAGKSALGLALAHALGGEVVNTDSMQLYRGMDIGTAKLSEDERDGVPHHLLDIWPVTETASVVEYRGLARVAVDDIRTRGLVPILVGGSGLYVRAVIDELDFPGTDPEVRARLEDDLAREGAVALHERLQVVDPMAAESILPSNARRVVRALEVAELGGTFHARLPGHRPAYDTVQLGVSVDRHVLDERIERRVDAMWAAGLVDEVRGLVGEGLREGRTASRALGYRQVLAHLDGEIGEDEARDATVRATRRFVRRQESWFRRDDRITWLPSGDTLADRALSVVGPVLSEPPE